jgi:hypothetical protein
LFSGKGNISEDFSFERMDLGMFDRSCPSLKTMKHLEEIRIDMNKSDRNNERYVNYAYKEFLD